MQEVLIFLLLCLGLGCLVGATVEVTGIYLAGLLRGDHYFQLWRNFWLSQAMGGLIFGGALIAWQNDIRYRLRSLLNPRLEAISLLSIICMTTVLIYTPLARYNNSLVLKPYFLFSLMIWAALRFDSLGAIVTNLVVGIVVIIGNLMGFLPVATVPADQRLVLHQFFALALGSTGLVIAAAIREKSEAIEARNEFLSIASHELKTPITSLKLQMHLFQKKLNALPEKRTSDLEYMVFMDKFRHQIARLVRIVDQLLDVTRIERRDISLDVEKFELSDLIRSLLLRLSNDLESAGCKVTVDLQPGITCFWDAFRFEQVLDNIISNAIKYAPDKPIAISAKEMVGVVLITIRDEGPGIDEARQPFIFNRFTRASQSSKIKGLGLGLFITRQIVEAHQGLIWVKSRMGQGTIFYLQVPSHPDFDLGS
jgi:signal transduction histidine kinase